jgi:nucleoside-diphosphate-sugar epimerase
MAALTLVSGADGFTGRHFMRAASLRGFQVAALSSDITDRQAVADEIARIAPSRFLHLAGLSFVGHADPRGFYDVNLLGSLNVLDALAALPDSPEKVVLASSANVYGNCTKSAITEEEPASPANHYAISKLAMEHAARTYDGQLPVVIARAFNYTGPGQAASFVVPKLVDHFRRRCARIQLGNLSVKREFNDVRSVCDMYMGLLERGKGGETYNLCSGELFALRDLLESLTQITGHAIEVDQDPSLVRPNEVRQLCGSPQKLAKVLGPRPRPPSLQETLQWMLETPAGEAGA